MAAQSPIHTHHAIDYVELSATDLAATRAFYGAAFGWELNDYCPDYTGFAIPGSDREMGGFEADPADRVGSPLVLLYSDDLDASAAGVVAAGGTLTREPYAFPGGRRFYFTDPAGNELGVWQSTP